MNNDLISREALKEEVEWFKHTGYDENNEPLFEYVELPTLLKIIDRAPAVEEVSRIEFKEPLPMVKAQKIVKALSKRQQGEWVYHEEPDYSTEDDCIVYYQCSVCGRRIYSSTVNVKDYPFCHCGAKMEAVRDGQ